MPDKDQFADIQFPPRGLDVSRGYAGQLPGTTPVAENVRLFEPKTGRARGGQRPGIERFIGQRLFTHDVIQCIDVVVHVSESAMMGSVPFGEFVPDPVDQSGIDDLYGTILDPTPHGTDTVIVNGQTVRDGGSGTQRTPRQIAGITPTLSATPLITQQTGYALDPDDWTPTAINPNTGEVIAGTFTVTPTAGTVLAVGALQPVTITFTPTDTGSYATVSLIVYITITAGPVSNVSPARQTATATLQSGTESTLTATFPAPTLSGSLIVAVVGGYCQETIDAVTIGGFTLEQIGTGLIIGPTFQHGVWIFSKANAASLTTVTAQVVPTQFAATLIIAEYTGMALTNPGDVGASASYTSGAELSPGSTGVLSQANEIVVAVFSARFSLTLTNPTGATNIVDTVLQGNRLISAMCDVEVASTSAVIPTIRRDTFTTDSWVAAVRTFKKL